MNELITDVRTTSEGIALVADHREKRNAIARIDVSASELQSFIRTLSELRNDRGTSLLTIRYEASVPLVLQVCIPPRWISCTLAFRREKEELDVLASSLMPE